MPPASSTRVVCSCSASCRLSRARIEDQPPMVWVAELERASERSCPRVERASADALATGKAIFDEAKD